jgi:hypothetical protein
MGRLMNTRDEIRQAIEVARPEEWASWNGRQRG